MSAARLLILGVLQTCAQQEKQALHGYDIRRELEMWKAEQWAQVAYGSIYYALKKMNDEGLVEVVSKDKSGGRPAKTEYRITERGKTEFQLLLRDYWWNRKPVIDPFQVALTFMNFMPRDELLAALRARTDKLNAELKGLEYLTAGSGLQTKNPYAPRHITENLRLAKAYYEAEVDWIQQTIRKIEAGKLP
ncbi:MAG: PadR family transcriptional regulator [Rubrobacteraceae bacterium]